MVHALFSLFDCDIAANGFITFKLTVDVHNKWKHRTRLRDQTNHYDGIAYRSTSYIMQRLLRK